MAASVAYVDQRTDCSICLNVFRIPKALPCLHTFCQECLQCYVSTSFNHKDRSFSCPVCRATCRPDFVSKKNGSKISVKEIVKHLPTNFYVISEAKSRERDSTCTQQTIDKSYFNKIEGLEKQIYDYQRNIEQQNRRNIIRANTLKQGIKFCSEDGSSGGSLEYKVEVALKKECNLTRENHDCLDTFLLDLKRLKEETIGLITPHNVEEGINNHQNPSHKKKRRKNKSKTYGNGVDSSNIEQNLISMKSDLEKTFEKLTISRAQNDLKTLMDKMQSVLVDPHPRDPEGEKTSLCLKIGNWSHSGFAFSEAGEFLFICSVKVMDDDTVVVCGKAPNLLLSYDANSGLMKSRFELSDEPTSMSVLNDRCVMVTFLNEMRIEIVDVCGWASPPRFVQKIETSKLYHQLISLDTNDTNNKIIAIFRKGRTHNYHVLQFEKQRSYYVFSPVVKSDVVNTGRVPGFHLGSRLAYIKQRDIILYPDTSQKCLLGFCLSSKKIVFKYYGDTENPLVLISDVCCNDSFIFIADKKHHKVHKLSFNGARLDIIKCPSFGIMWPLHMHVNKRRTMVICGQRRDTSYDLKTFLS